VSVHISHFGLGVTDVEKSRAFYENVFGFEFDTEIQAEGDYVAQLMQLPTPCRVRAVLLVKDGFTLELLHTAEPGMTERRERVLNEPGLTHLNMRVTNAAEIREKVLQWGGTVVEPSVLPVMSGPELGAYSEAMYVRDPDGQLIEVIPDVEAPGGWLPLHLRPKS
jgi:catechol 2,3-dioxygenase-like lactoylglutathione lyase family enzyme